MAWGGAGYVNPLYGNPGHGSAGYGSSQQYTSIVYNQFNKRSNDLQNEKREAEDSINIWASTLRSQIDDHVREQKALLQCYYNERQDILNKKKTQIIDDVWKFYQQNDIDGIKILLKECETMKFELLVEFDYDERSISFIQCVTKEHLAQKKKNDSSATKTANYKAETTLEFKNDKGFEKNKSSTTDSYRDQASISGESVNRPSAMQQPRDAYDRSMGGNNSQKPEIVSNDGLDGKCPICFMIYPKTMQPREQEIHVNQHYS